MRVIARRTLNQFAERHAETKVRLDGWYHMVKRATYAGPHHVQRDFPTVSFLGDGVTVFNIGSCRLEVHMRYDLGIVFIRSIDTHEEYDRRNKARKK
ncbi:MAG TPA: type II toxin-antitoxin system HigB family toxin [Gemmatimonadaceae bacterium]|nr:type II toxin-antitoxin system HigB family toxin [Gemmatimonadaceae bacterium]